MERKSVVLESGYHCVRGLGRPPARVVFACAFTLKDRLPRGHQGEVVNLHSVAQAADDLVEVLALGDRHRDDDITVELDCDALDGLTGEGAPELEVLVVAGVEVRRHQVLSENSAEDLRIEKEG